MDVLSMSTSEGMDMSPQMSGQMSGPGGHATLPRWAAEATAFTPVVTAPMTV